MDLLIQTVVSGVVLGATYALVSVGLTICFGIGKIVNFAHGEFLMVSAFLTFFAVHEGAPYPVAVLLAVAGTALLAYAVERLVVAPGLYAADEHSSIIVTFALSLVLQGVMQLLAGTSPRVVNPPWADVQVRFGSVVIDGQRALTGLMAMLVIAGLGLWLTRAPGGMRLRALSQNPRGALYSGIDVGRSRTKAFVLANALAALAGALLAPTLTVSPSMGTPMVIVAFTVVILGGLGSVYGAALAAMVVGLTFSFVSTYLSVAWTSAFGWVLVIAVILIRPQGLMGAKPTRA